MTLVTTVMSAFCATRCPAPGRFILRSVALWSWGVRLPRWGVSREPDGWVSAAGVDDAVGGVEGAGAGTADLDAVLRRELGDGGGFAVLDDGRVGGQLERGEMAVVVRDGEGRVVTVAIWPASVTGAGAAGELGGWAWSVGAVPARVWPPRLRRLRLRRVRRRGLRRRETSGARFSCASLLSLHLALRDRARTECK